MSPTGSCGLLLFGVVVEPLTDETELKEVDLGRDGVGVLKVKSPTLPSVPHLNYTNVSKQPLMTANIAGSYSGLHVFSLNHSEFTLLPQGCFLSDLW